MKEKIASILKCRIEHINLIEIDKWYTNTSYFLDVSDSKKYFCKVPKYVDWDFGSNFLKEAFLWDILSKKNLCPSIVYADEEILITEYIDGTHPYLFDEKNQQQTSRLLEQIHSFSYRVFIDKIPKITPFLLFKDKISVRMEKIEDANIKKMYTENIWPLLLSIKKIDILYGLHHGDLRYDNILQTGDTHRVIDLEGAKISDKRIDIAYHYTWNIFFDCTDKKVFSWTDYSSWLNFFSWIVLEPYLMKKIAILNYFSDLSWAYLYQQSKGNLFVDLKRKTQEFNRLLSSYQK